MNNTYKMIVTISDMMDYRSWHPHLSNLLDGVPPVVCRRVHVLWIETNFSYIFQAASHIHRFRNLDENVLRMSSDAGESKYYCRYNYR
jgi:hypothetical protein